MAVYTIGAKWDEGRNTSRVVPVPPDALPNALRELTKWRTENPAHAAWVAAGAPNVTHDQHRERFGEPYGGVKARRGAA